MQGGVNRFVVPRSVAANTGRPTPPMAEEARARQNLGQGALGQDFALRAVQSCIAKGGDGVAIKMCVHSAEGYKSLRLPSLSDLRLCGHASLESLFRQGGMRTNEVRLAQGTAEERSATAIIHPAHKQALAPQHVVVAQP